MKYVNANHVLPETLILEIQKYVQGETIYIPKQEESYRKWGTVTGSRDQLDKRNATIRDAFKNGTSIQDLSEEFFLSIESIKRIVYRKHG